MTNLQKSISVGTALHQTIQPRNTVNILRLRFPSCTDPIICSLLDVDFYKFTMGQFIWKHFRDVKVKFAFKCRTKGVALTKVIPESALRVELDHVMDLCFNNSEIHYLRGTHEYGTLLMFSEPYLQYLKELRLPQYELCYVGDEVRLNVESYWGKNTYWETLMLSIMNELYYRFLIGRMSKFERDAINADGVRRLFEKVKILKTNPQIVFSDFGTRRRHSRDWQDYVDAVLAEELPKEQFRGTSSTYLAMKHGLMPMGTNAHELQMVMAGLAPRIPGALIDSQQKMLKLWWEDYGEALSIFLPDTFGTESFLRNMRMKWAFKWKGFRQDSGDPIWEGEKWISFYRRHGIDTKQKMMTASDGLELSTMLKIHKHFHKRIKTNFGWGTNLTNDLGPAPLSMVVKAVEANGQSLVKLSNNPAKAMGDPVEIDRYMKEFKYGRHKRTACKY